MFKFGFHNPDVRCFLHVCLVALAKLPCLRELFALSTKPAARAVADQLRNFLLQTEISNSDAVLQELSKTDVDDGPFADNQASKEPRKILQPGQQDATLLLEDLLILVNAREDCCVKFNTAIFDLNSQQLNNERTEMVCCKFTLSP